MSTIEPIPEPELESDDIQGDALAGFRKDNVSLLFVRFGSDIGKVREWLTGLAAGLASLTAVHGFNEAYSAAKRAGGGADSEDLTATWVNIGFTAEGLRKLMPVRVDQLEPKFLQGAAARATVVGDPRIATGGDGNPQTWKVGSGEKIPDAMIIVAADKETDLAERVRQLRDALAGIADVFLEQPGRTRPAPYTGHEHFGFRDGISQPGVRGKLSATGAFVTPRLFKPEDPLALDFSAPGEPLVFPGEFVLGYPTQIDARRTPGPNRGPEWAKNGSYLSFRRLRQDVAAFVKAVESATAAFSKAGFSDVSEKRTGSMLVGRWPNGTPVARTPKDDHPDIAKDRHLANNFFYRRETKPPIWTGKDDVYPQAQIDGLGQRCPLPAHIRKVNPRDETAESGPEERTLQRRMMRRGIPYGTELAPGAENDDRGLLFISYQTDVNMQFEFVWQAWSNRSNAPIGGAGLDQIIGQVGTAKRESLFVDSDDQTKSCPIELSRFVITTGAAYLFVPPISLVKTGMRE